MADYRENRNWLGFQDGVPFRKFVRKEDIPADLAMYAKPHTPKEGDNAGVTHYRLYMTAMEVQLVSLKKDESGRYGPVYNVTLIDTTDETEYVVGMPAKNLSTLTLLFAALDAPTHFKIKFGAYPEVWSGKERILPACSAIVYVDSKWVSNPNFDKAYAEPWYKACEMTYTGEKIALAKKEIIVPPSERKVIAKNEPKGSNPLTPDFYQAFAKYLMQALDAKLESFEPTVPETDYSTPAVADDDLPF